MERLAYWLDSSIPIPGTNYRIGWEPIIGLIPGVGDLVTAAISGWIVLQAWRLGISKWTLVRMLGNIGLDALVGIVPLVGDVFDAAFKSNQRNMALLRRRLERRAARR